MKRPLGKKASWTTEKRPEQGWENRSNKGSDELDGEEEEKEKERCSRGCGVTKKALQWRKKDNCKRQ